MALLISLAWVPLIPDLKPAVNAYLAFLLALRLSSLRWPVLTPRRWLLFPLTLAGMAGVFGSYHSLVGQDAGTALLTTMLVLKLLEMRRLRDVRLATILFGFLLISQFLFDQSPLRALYLASLLVLDFAVMVDLGGCPENGPGALFGAVQTAGKLSLQALPLAAVLFVLFPRLDSPLWGLPEQSDSGRTGIKDWLEPGALSELALSAEPAFRVRFEGPVPPQDRRYWRGLVLWHTDGRRWTGWPGEAPMGTAKELVARGKEIAYRVDLEPSGKRWMFALDLPLQVDADARIRADFQVLSAAPIKEHRSYRARSTLGYLDGELDLDQEMAGTQLPDNITARMEALVSGWQRRAANGEELVARALAFFRVEPFYYTLIPPRLGPNPIDSFLFETRRGFCEHYASSLALLMRIGGIPSRIVLGYMGGEYNPIGDYLIVRQSDAHAWVEVWLEGKGWVRVDPTAAIAPERVERIDLLDGLGAGAPLRFRGDTRNSLLWWVHDLGLVWDTIETGWRDWVLGLSSARQQRMLETLGLGSLREYGLVIALIITSGVVLGLLLTALSRTSPPRDPLERIYARFCTRLARVGLARRAGEGPLDFSRRVVAVRPDLRIPVESFMALYLPRRYGTEARPGDRKELEHSLRRFWPTSPRREQRGGGGPRRPDQ